MYEINPYLEKVWRYGRPPDLWIKNIDVVKEFIAKYNLKPIPMGHLPMSGTMAELQPKTTTKRLTPKPIPFPGGIRLAHLHYQDDIYVLNAEQWKEFSGRLMKDFQTKLATVKTIGFEQLIELSAAIDSLP